MKVLDEVCLLELHSTNWAFVLTINHLKDAVFAVSMAAFGDIRVFESVTADCTLGVLANNVFNIDLDCFIEFAWPFLKHWDF